jgi:alpha-glucosidase (family GH31 glycosyl hydrolase)
VNLYGTHPFFVGVVDGAAYGVLFLSSNGMDVYLEEKSLIYKVIGGIIDLYVFTGPTPADVAAQYTELIGRPALQPYWAFGFHNCRFGYTSIYEVEQVASNYFAANV